MWFINTILCILIIIWKKKNNSIIHSEAQISDNQQINHPVLTLLLALLPLVVSTESCCCLCPLSNLSGVLLWFPGVSTVQHVSANHTHDLMKTEMMFWFLAAVQTRAPTDASFVWLFVCIVMVCPGSLPFLCASFIFFTFAVVIEGIYLHLACPVSKTIPVSRSGGGFGRKTRRCFWMMVKWFEMRVSFHFEQLR